VGSFYDKGVEEKGGTNLRKYKEPKSSPKRPDRGDKTVYCPRRDQKDRAKTEGGKVHHRETTNAAHAKQKSICPRDKKAVCNKEGKKQGAWGTTGSEVERTHR